MKTLVIGATGYVGSAVAHKFRARGYDSHGLARNVQARTTLETAGIKPIDGDLADLDRVRTLVRDFDVIVLAAPVPRESEPAIASAIIEGCRGAKRHFIFTSGTGVVSTDSKDGRWSEITYAEDDPFPLPQRQNQILRVRTEELVRRAAADDLHTTVMRPPLIYGHGGSNQVPAIFESVRKTGNACYLGFGLNLYSNVHVDDLAEAYCLAVERGVSGALYHTVAGEVNFRSIAEAVAMVAGCATQSLSYQEACGLWGELWTENALAVNSRTVSRRARHDLGWEPRHIDLIEDIRHGSYRAHYLETLRAKS